MHRSAFPSDTPVSQDGLEGDAATGEEAKAADEALQAAQHGKSA